MSEFKVESKNVILPLVAAGGVAFASLPSAALATTGSVNSDVEQGIADSIETVKALSPLALACLSVALVPLGAMLTLRFLNMVLSRV